MAHNDVRNDGIVHVCQVCAEFRHVSKQSQHASCNPHGNTRIRPWSRVATDLFSLKSKDYVVLVDHYSDYIEVSPLTDYNLIIDHQVSQGNPIQADVVHRLMSRRTKTMVTP